MMVIAISSRTFSRERNLARGLAEQLGFRCVEPEVVLERAAAWGPAQDDLLDALLNPPSFFDCAADQKRRCLSLLQAALDQELQAADAVCYGNVAEIVPAHATHVIRLEIQAPLRLRCSLAQDELRFTSAEALVYLQKLDRDRARWLRHVRRIGLTAVATHVVAVELKEMDVQELVPRVARAIEAQCKSARCPVDRRKQDCEVPLVDWILPGAAGLDGYQVVRPSFGRSWAMIALVLCGVLAYSAALTRFTGSLSSYFFPADAEARTFAGVITDTLCGYRHDFSRGTSEAECVKACVRRGAGTAYALYDGKDFYRLSDAQTAAKYAAQRVVISGSVDKATHTLRIESIARRL